MSMYIVPDETINKIISYLAGDEVTREKHFPGVTVAKLPEIGRAFADLNELAAIGRYGKDHGFEVGYTPGFVDATASEAYDAAGSLHYNCAEDLACESPLLDRIERLRDSLELLSTKEKTEIAAKAISKEADDSARHRALGEAWLEENKPAWATHVIEAELEESDCDYYTDYFGSKTIKTVVLGFSHHGRNLFPEMRKFGATHPEVEETARTARENRENYSMGGGNFIADHRYSGWHISKRGIGGWHATAIGYAIENGDPLPLLVKGSSLPTVKREKPETANA